MKLERKKILHKSFSRVLEKDFRLSFFEGACKRFGVEFYCQNNNKQTSEQ